MEGLDSAEDGSMEDVFLQDDLSPTIAEHAEQCRKLFLKFLDAPDIVPDPTVVDDQLARFSLWASNMDVYGPLNVSLDYRLRFSPTAADIIHQLLDIIYDTLMSLKPINDRPPPISSRKRQRISMHGDSEATRRADDDTSDSDSDVDPVEENILKITETVGGTLTRLFRLSNAVRKSAKANRARKIERYQDDEEANKAIAELRLYTECYIRFRFPMAPVALRSALAEANALRLRRLYYQRTHRRRIDLSFQSPQTTPGVLQLPKMTGSAPAPTVRFAPGTLPKPATNKTSGHAPVPATNATTARQTNVAALYAKSTTEVPRAKSALVNNKLSFPPIPPTQQCPYCGVIVEFKNSAKTLLWQNHVIGDLEPFICVFSHCLEGGHHGTGTGTLTFETSKAWSGHMQTAHGHTWECRAPAHADPMVFDQEILYREHSIKEHGVPEAHAGTLSSAARRPVLDKVMECPFGDDFQAVGKEESSAVFKNEALQSHVTAHMKEIALLTLQKLPSDDDENPENVDSDQPLVDDGPGFGNLRGSMYSVLEDEELDLQDDDEEAADKGEDHREEDKDKSGMTELHHAVQDGNLPLVESLIQKGASLSSRDSGGRTALHFAAMEQSQRHDLLQLILNAGGEATVNLGDDYGQTALHYAAERDSIEIISILVSHGADARITDSFEFSPYLWAVVAGQRRAVGQLLAGSAKLSSADGKSALAWAAGLGWSSIAEIIFIRGGSSWTSQTMALQEALEDAAASGDFSTALLLLQYGADPNLRDRDGWSAIHWAAEEGHQGIVTLLMEKGANVNAVSSYGTSPLHCAANGGHTSIVSLLLDHGADPLKSTCHGWTALHHAAFMGHSHVVQRLLTDDGTRSNVSQQDNHGWSVLHLAVHSRDLATVHLLLDKSVIAEPRALLDESGLTAEEWLDFGPAGRSHKARATSNLAFHKSRCCAAVTGLRQAVGIGTGNVPMIKLLLRLGRGINGTNSGRRTALYHAAKRNMLPVMDLLLSMGADPNILPLGRRTWEEFISDPFVLLRLSRAGYRRQDTDPEVEGQIRLALRESQRRLSEPDRSVAFALDESPSPMPNQSGPRFPDLSSSRSADLSSFRSADLSSTQSPDPSITQSPYLSSSELPYRSRSNLLFPKSRLPNFSPSVTPTLSPASTHQTNDNKRKASPGRTSWWKQLLDGGRRGKK